jgi:hypothetical protein
VNEADMKAEMNTSPTNANVQPAEKRGFDTPLFELPKMAVSAVFRGIAEQGAADYGIKVIEISSVNTTSAFDFFTDLLSTKSLSEIMTLSAVQARKNFDVASAQNKELWDLAQKAAIETAEPIKKSVAKALQNVA